MDLLERYLAAVERHLPDDKKADVAAELRDVLLSQVEERESALGRPLDKSEVEAVLLAFGNPLMVAGRYRTVQHLIGPEVFPYWWAALKVAFMVVAAVYLTLVILAILGGREIGRAVSGAMPDLIDTSLMVLGGVTLVCAAIERWGKPSVLARWRPSELPPLGARQRARFDTMMEIGAGVIFLAWWLGFIRFADFLPQGADHVRLALAPVWDVWWWPILAFTIYEMAVNAIELVKPGWRRMNAALRMLCNSAGAAILLGILQADTWIVVRSADPSLTQAAADNFARIGISIGIVVFVLKLANEAWRQRDLMPWPGPRNAASA
jgi:hypothetical protein